MPKRSLAATLLITLLLLALPLSNARSQSIADVVARAKPAVVFVFSRLPQGDFSMGSGFLVDSNGLIVTAQHIFEAGGVPGVAIPGLAPMPASIVASDRTSDIVILKVNRNGLPTIPLGNSSVLRQGDEILVMGYPRVEALGVYDSTVTRGIVGSLRVDSIQIDAAMNPGNSGGPVLNLRGEAVGISVARLQGAVGINFAVPINTVKPILVNVGSSAALVPSPAQVVPTPTPRPTLAPTPIPTPGPALPATPQAAPSPVPSSQPVPSIGPSPLPASEERNMFDAPEDLYRIAWLNEKTVLATAGVSSMPQVRLYDIESGSAREVGPGGCSVLSSDRTRVAWVRGPEGSGEAWILGLRSMQARLFVDLSTLGVGTGLFGGEGRVNCLTWSPDGQRLALIMGGVLSNGPILILSTSDARVLQEIKNEGYSLGDPAWSPDGARLAFSSTLFVPGGRGEYAANQIEVFDFARRARSKLLDVPSKFRARNLLFTRDGRELLFDAFADGPQIFALGGAGLRRLVAGASPAWYPDRRSLTFVRRRSIYITEMR